MTTSTHPAEHASSQAHAHPSRPSQQPGSPASHPMLQLQRTAGNKAVSDLVAIQRDCGCGGASGPEHEDGSEHSDVQRVVGVQRAPEAGQRSALLAKGSSGPAVTSAQQDLNALGATPQLDTDGRFGSRTDTAVRLFQRSHRLVPDGILGSATATMLRNERATEPANFLVACHTPERPGPDGPEEKALAEQEAAGGGNLIAEPGTGTKVNLTLVLTTTSQDRDEAAAVGGKVVSVASMAAFQAALDQHPNIGNLAIISHGGVDGTVVIGGSNVFLAALAEALTKRTAGSIDRIQFLGCNIGRDASGMGALKTKTGAGAVEGTNCFLETQRLAPARRGNGKGKEILTRQDLPASSTFPGKPMSDGEFGTLLQQLIPAHVDVNGVRIKQPDCILGLPAGTRLSTVAPAKLAELYFLRSGNLVFRFVPGGVCWEDLKFDRAADDGCKRVQV